MNRGQFFIISAPSGTGKSTIIAALRKRLPKIYFSISFTTRYPRVGEKKGIDYFFITKEDFLSRVKTGEMLEYTEIFGNFYGTSIKIISKVLFAMGKDILLDINVVGAVQIKNNFKKVMLIFLFPPSCKELECRLRSRGTEDEDTILLRLKEAKREIDWVSYFTYLVVNNLIEQTINDLMAIIRADCLRRTRINEKIYDKT